MKQYLQPIAWGVTMASVVALASSFALSMAVGTAQAATAHDHNHPAPAAADAIQGERWVTDAALRKGHGPTRHRAAYAQIMTMINF